MITLAEAKAFMSVTSTANDALITVFIDYITAEIEAYCDRTLIQTSYTGERLRYKFNQYDAWPSPEFEVNDGYAQLFLDNYPVTTLSLYTGTNSIPTGNYIFDIDSGAITLFQLYDDSKGNLTANYTAGYVIATGNAYSVPNDLRYVALQGVRSLYGASGTVIQSTSDVKSKKVGDFSVTYGEDNTFLSSQGNLIKTYVQSNSVILNRYKKVNL